MTDFLDCATAIVTFEQKSQRSYVSRSQVADVGGVITPAARITTIVPESAELKFEVRISPVDIDQVREGQPAWVRLSAFNRNTTPELKAMVVMVSPASARDPSTGQEHYIAYIQLAEVEDALSQLKGIRLVPGMPAEVFISTQERTAVSYLMKPFTDQMSRAFSENVEVTAVQESSERRSKNIAAAKSRLSRR